MISQKLQFLTLAFLIFLALILFGCAEKYIDPQFECGDTIPNDHGFVFGRFQLVSNLLGDGYTGFQFRKLDTQETYKIEFTKNEENVVKALMLPQGTYRIENLFTGPNGKMLLDSEVKTIPLSVNDKLPITVFSITPKVGFYLGDFYVYKNNVNIKEVPLGKVSTFEFGISNFLNEFDNTKNILLEKFPELKNSFSFFNLLSTKHTPSIQD